MNELNSIVNRAKKALEARRVRKTQKVYIPSLDAEVTFKSVTVDEKQDINNQAGGDSRMWIKKYILASCDDLRKIAVELVDAEL